MDSHVALGVARHVVPCQHGVEPPARRLARRGLGRAVGRLCFVLGALLGQVGKLAQREQTLPQRLGREIDGPVDAVVLEWRVQGRAVAVSVRAGDLLKRLLPLSVAEARVAVLREGVDDVIESLLPGGLGGPRGRLVVLGGELEKAFLCSLVRHMINGNACRKRYRRCRQQKRTVFNVPDDADERAGLQDPMDLFEGGQVGKPRGEKNDLSKQVISFLISLGLVSSSPHQ